MTRERRVLGVVPARGGSKGIPRKNLAALGGRPLLAWTIEAAVASQQLTRIVVSTDDDEIAAVAADLGADVPFRRPPELATDMALTHPVVRHALEHAEAEEGARYDAIVLLQPTCPFRTGRHIDECVERLFATDADSVVTVVDVGPAHPFRMKRLLSNGRLLNFIEQGFEDMRPRQVLPKVFIRNGAVYAARRHVVVELGALVGEPCLGIEMNERESINIDGPLDLLVAERLLEQA